MRETAQSRRPPHWQARSGTLLVRAGPSPFGHQFDQGGFLYLIRDSRV
jgi:hypothetical protein